MRDAWFEHLRHDEHLLAEARSTALNGPSAVSHSTYRKDRTPIPHRMDYIFVSKGVDVTHAEYDYGAGLAAGSDHGFVWAKLEVT